MLSHLVREIILPPGCLLVLALLGLVLARRYKRASVALFTASFLVLYLLSIPLVSGLLRGWSESVPPLPLDRAHEYGADAIVVLGGGVRFEAPEYEGRAVCSGSTLKRVTYGSYLAKELKLPVLVTGGYGRKPGEAEGVVMKAHLESVGVPEVLVEKESRNTFENAKFSKAIAENAGIKKVLLVTSADHARRAEEVFRKQGFQVLSAPTDYRTAYAPWERGVLRVVPTHAHFDESCRALRAQLGLLWYRLRH